MISSHLGLINVDLELATLLGGGSMNQIKKKHIKVHRKLRKEIQNVASDTKYDVVLIDCPPNFNIVTKSALIASDKILIPAKPDYLSTLGIEYLYKSVNDLISNYNERVSLDSDEDKICPKFLGVVFTMSQVYGWEPISAQRQYMAQTKRLKVPLMNNYFRENKSIFANAPETGLPVVLGEYKNHTHSRIVTEVKKFTDEFIDITGI